MTRNKNHSNNGPASTKQVSIGAAFAQQRRMVATNQTKKVNLGALVGRTGTVGKNDGHSGQFNL